LVGLWIRGVESTITLCFTKSYGIIIARVIVIPWQHRRYHILTAPMWNCYRCSML